MVKKLICGAGSRAMMSVVASLFFLLGSILFLPAFSQYAVEGVWCFIAGSAVFLLMSSLDVVFSERS
ncbi:hypothetical protein TDB9533_03089 [Thalassocella blandensis]|nr:hypothetical protein TDB9533_03089 [Thalassocella blandensis]